MVINADGSSTVTDTNLASNGTVIDSTTTTTSADGLIVTTQTNVGGDPITQTDTTVINPDGSQTETVAVKSADGVLESQTVTTTSADQKTKTIASDLNGDGVVDQLETLAEQPDGSVIDTVTTYNPDGSQNSQTVTTTSANGLSTTSSANIDGKIDFNGNRYHGPQSRWQPDRNGHDAKQQRYAAQPDRHDVKRE